jgi:GT2 family glycosyltransferase
MDLSIIIVNYKTEKLILDCLQSIQEYTQGIDYEVIVADNLFVEGANAEVVEQFPKVHWLNVGYNAGFARANNVGLGVAKGTYILFLNADTLVFDNAIGKALTHLVQDHATVAVGGLQLYADRSSMPYYHTLNEIRRTFYIFPNLPVFQRLLDWLLPDESFVTPTQTNNLVGAFLMTRKSTLDEIGPWDEDFFMYGEDVELSYRLSQKGKLCYFDDVKFIHLVNENQFRRTNISWVNRFSTQMQVSNLRWIRKSYGVIPFLLIMLNYSALVPIFWSWKILLNVFRNKPLMYETKNQKIFSLKVGILLKYFWRILFLRKGLYKIKEEENIDLRIWN